MALNYKTKLETKFKYKLHNPDYSPKLGDKVWLAWKHDEPKFCDIEIYYDKSDNDFVFKQKSGNYTCADNRSMDILIDSHIDWTHINIYRDGKLVFVKGKIIERPIMRVIRD